MIMRCLIVGLLAAGLAACNTCTTRCCELRGHCDMRDPFYQFFNYRNMQFCPHKYIDMNSAEAASLVRKARAAAKTRCSTPAPPANPSLDQKWANCQNPNGYTIEITARASKSQAARSCCEGRSVKLKYIRCGLVFYHEVLGNYQNHAEAKKALDNLPAEIKQGAVIKNWKRVQTGPCR